MQKPRLILGIDTSCDETSMAIFDTASEKVLSNVISSQIALHQEYGGVVPELASREHVKNLPAVFEACLKEAGVTSDDIEAVAVTQTPGLVGCLLVGMSFGKALASRLNVPLYAVNHLEAHLFSPYIEKDIAFPFLGLVVSGGHTSFYLAKSYHDIELLGQTIDDAAGEAFDKGAKLLGLGYPGGPVVDKKSQEGDVAAYAFSRPRVKMGEQYLSFSGMKTALMQHVNAEMDRQQVSKACEFPANVVNDFCASLQNAIVETLCDKLKYFLKNSEAKRFGLSGGVAMNSLLRVKAAEVCESFKIPCDLAAPQYCTDNAAMIAYLASHQQRQEDVYSLSPIATQRINAKQLAKDHANRPAKN